MIYDIASNLQHVNLANIAIAAISIVFLIATKEYLNDIVNEKFKKNFSLPCDLVLVSSAFNIYRMRDKNLRRSKKKSPFFLLKMSV